MAGAEPKPPLADETTTNLKLQKIKDTDYAGNFPTIYNNNLDLIDVLNNKQDKLIAGSGINIASDGKTISAEIEKPWNVLDSANNIHTLINVSKINGKTTLVVNKKIRFKITAYKSEGTSYCYYYYTSKVLEPFSWQISPSSNYNISIGFDYFSVGITKGLGKGGIYFLISNNSTYDIDIHLEHTLINLSLAYIKNNTSKIPNTSSVQYSTTQPVDLPSSKVYYCIEYQD